MLKAGGSGFSMAVNPASGRLKKPKPNCVFPHVAVFRNTANRWTYTERRNKSEGGVVRAEGEGYGCP